MPRCMRLDVGDYVNYTGVLRRQVHRIYTKTPYYTVVYWMSASATKPSAYHATADSTSRLYYHPRVCVASWIYADISTIPNTPTLVRPLLTWSRTPAASHAASSMELAVELSLLRVDSVGEVEAEAEPETDASAIVVDSWPGVRDAPACQLLPLSMAWSSSAGGASGGGRSGV